MRATPSSQTFLCTFVSFVGGKIWIRRVGDCFIQFCKTCFDFLPKTAIVWFLILAGRYWIRSFQIVGVTIFTSAAHHFCWLWVQSLDIEELLETPSYPKSWLLVLLMMSSRPLTLLSSTVGPLFPPHITDTLLKSSSPNIDNGQIPKCSNPSKYSSWLKEPDVQRRLNLSDQGNQFFF